MVNFINSVLFHKLVNKKWRSTLSSHFVRIYTKFLLNNLVLPSSSSQYPTSNNHHPTIDVVHPLGVRSLHIFHSAWQIANGIHVIHIKELFTFSRNNISSRTGLRVGGLHVLLHNVPLIIFLINVFTQHSSLSVQFHSYIICLRSILQMLIMSSFYYYLNEISEPHMWVAVKCCVGLINAYLNIGVTTWSEGVLNKSLIEL